MLQDPVKGVLVPLSPDEARALSGVGLRVSPPPVVGKDGWTGLAEAELQSDKGTLALGPLLDGLPNPPDSSGPTYDKAYSALIGGNHAAAASAFAAVALGGGPAAPAAYGLALAMEELGLHEAAEALAGFVSDLPGYDDPRAAALAGYAAFQRRQTKAARVYLAKAARIARMKPEFRAVQRFAQRVLLMQQFALGD